MAAPGGADGRRGSLVVELLLELFDALDARLVGPVEGHDCDLLSSHEFVVMSFSGESCFDAFDGGTPAEWGASRDRSYRRYTPCPRIDSSSAARLSVKPRRLNIVASSPKAQRSSLPPPG